MPGDVKYGGRVVGFGYRVLFWVFLRCYFWLPRLFLGLLVFLLNFRRLRDIASSDAIVGVDNLGLVQASVLASFFRKPLFFFSFEIMFADELGGARKKIEIKSCANVRAWFVQDGFRADLLKKENCLRGEPVLVPLGNAGFPLGANRRLRDELGVPVDKKVMILVGSIEEWAGAPALIESFCHGVDDDWCFILHGRYGVDRLEWYAQLSERNRGRIFISSVPRDFDSMADIFSGVDVGLAFYVPKSGHPFLGKNIENIGLSSGKISTYLRHGVPVITNVHGELAKLIDIYGAGKVVSGVGDLCLALNDISPEMRNGASQLFQDVFDFRNYEKEVFESLCSVKRNCKKQG